MSSRACTVCLEDLGASESTCGACGEPIQSDGGAYSYPAPFKQKHWLRYHWRPLVTMVVTVSVLVFGIALRYLAPGRFTVRRAAKAPIAQTSCEPACWPGEACQGGECTWQAPQPARHVRPDGTVRGPFSLPADVTGILAIDDDRFAVSRLAGVEIRSTKGGEVLTLLREAPHALDLTRVGSVIYATSPRGIYIIDLDSLRVVKTMDLGGKVEMLRVHPSKPRAVASLPSALSVVVLSTELHAEIDRIYLGDDTLGPVAMDDSGTRAVVTNGRSPAATSRDLSATGALFAFDPSQYASVQDRVRASVPGNPMSVVLTPDGSTVWATLQARNALVPIEWLPSGTMRQADKITTCREPEQVALSRLDRRLVVRCFDGRALEIFEATTGKLVRHVPLDGRPTALEISADGLQAAVALMADDGQSGAIRFIDMRTFDGSEAKLTTEPSRLSTAPSGSPIVAISDRSKVAWVLE